MLLKNETIINIMRFVFLMTNQSYIQDITFELARDFTSLDDVIILLVGVFLTLII